MPLGHPGMEEEDSSQLSEAKGGRYHHHQKENIEIDIF